MTGSYAYDAFGAVRAHTGVLHLVVLHRLTRTTPTAWSTCAHGTEPADAPSVRALPPKNRLSPLDFQSPALQYQRRRRRRCVR